MRVEIPMLPPKACSPNWRGHWAQRYKATKSFRDAVCICALENSHLTRPLYDKAELSITIVIRDCRGYKDPDNALACLKPAIDGLQDAGIIQNDRNLKIRLPIVFEVDKKRAPLLILEVT